VTSTIHLRPTAALAERVLLPGDPGRALSLAQALLREPRMFNHNRGLWGYTGEASDGAPLTIQATGMGGPSTAIVVSELIELGARRMVRVGTAGGLDPSLGLGELLIATGALSDDGTSRALGAGRMVPASEPLLASLLRCGEEIRSTCGTVVSTDLFYDAEDRHGLWREAGARAVEMEAATLFTLAARRGAHAACVVAISDTLGPVHARISPEALAEAELLLGELAIAGLSGNPGDL
jgi:DeoD family purine-nucleoside phosphorylase